MTDRKRSRTVTQWTALTGLSCLVLFWCGFALLSGADGLGAKGFGDGIRGLIDNSPNALPWVASLALLVVAYRWPVVGGLSFVGLGLLTIVQFDTGRHLPAFLAITAPFLVLGAFLALAGWRSGNR